MIERRRDEIKIFNFNTISLCVCGRRVGGGGGGEEGIVRSRPRTRVIMSAGKCLYECVYVVRARMNMYAYVVGGGGGGGSVRTPARECVSVRVCKSVSDGLICICASMFSSM